MTAEVAQGHRSLFIDMPKEASDSKQALGEPDESLGTGRDLETSRSSCDRLEWTVNPKARFNFDVPTATFSLDPASSKTFLQYPCGPSLSSTFVCYSHCVERIKWLTGSFSMSIEEAPVVVRRRLVNWAALRVIKSIKKCTLLLHVFLKSFSTSHTLSCSIE